jgi:methionyl-tRNA formyltransferase
MSASDDPLRVVVVSRPGALNEYLLARLVTVAKVEKLFTAVPPNSSRTLSWASQRLRAGPLRAPVRAVRRRVLSRLDAEFDSRIAELLPPPAGSAFDATTFISSSDLNGDVGRRLICDIAPDLMILSLAPLLKPELYLIPRLGTVNVHWGISPNYRGERSIFTALRRGDYSSIGATLHYLDRGIDTGPAVAQCWPSLDPTDDLVSILAKTAHLVGDMLTDFVERLRVEPVAGQTLVGPGRLVRGRDRRVWHHLSYAAQRRLLSRTPPSTPGRIVHYW